MTWVNVAQVDALNTQRGKAVQLARLTGMVAQDAKGD